MSKFDFQAFAGDIAAFAVNSEKYSKDKAIAIFEQETGCHVGSGMDDYAVSTAWVRLKEINGEGKKFCV